jgi:hypothetical protein
MVIVFDHEKLEVYRIAVEYADAAEAIALAARFEIGTGTATATGVGAEDSP